MGGADHGSFARRLACSWALLAAAPFPAAGQPAGEWTTGPPLPTPRRLHAAAAAGDRLVVLGGCGSPCFSPPQHLSVVEETRVEVFEPRAGAWRRGASLPHVFFDGAAAAPGDGAVYTFGGAFSPGVTARYDPTADAWSERAPLPRPRHGLAAAAIGGLVYVVGGSDGRSVDGALDVYDPAADRWTRGPPLPTPRTRLAAAALGGRLFALGGAPDAAGRGATDAVDVFDPATGAWARAAPLPSPRQGSAAAVIGDRLFVFGGFVRGLGVLAETLEYDAEGDRWLRRADLPTPRDQAAVAELGGRAHLVGGSVDCHCRALGSFESFDPPPGPTPPPGPPPPAAQEADLSCGFTVPAAGRAGERVELVLTLRNSGPDAAAGARPTLELPPQLGDLTWTCAASPGGACPPGGGGSLPPRVDVAAGGSVTFALAATVAPAPACPLPSSLAVSARAAVPAGVRDPRRGNDSCAEAIRYAGVADLALTEAALPGTALPGDEVRFFFTAANRGPDAACGATLLDLASVGLSGRSWSCVAPAGCSPPAGAAPGLLDLPAGGAAALTMTATVDAEVPCEVPHRAALAPPDGVVDPRPEDNASFGVVFLPLCPPPTVEKRVVSPFVPEDGFVEYVVRVENPGLPLLDDAGDEWVDVLPLAVEPFEVSAEHGVATLAGQTWRWSGDVRSSVTFRLRAAIAPGHLGEVVCNQGTFVADAGRAEIELASDDPELPGEADPTCFEVIAPLPEPAFPVPALGGVGRVLAALLLAAGGVAALRRRRGG